MGDARAKWSPGSRNMYQGDLRPEKVDRKISRRVFHAIPLSFMKFNCRPLKNCKDLFLFSWRAEKYLIIHLRVGWG